MLYRIKYEVNGTEGEVLLEADPSLTSEDIIMLAKTKADVNPREDTTTLGPATERWYIVE